MPTKNLGVIVALWSGVSAPTNTKLLWWDTANLVHKAYNPSTTTWEPLMEVVQIDNATIKKNGSGQLYVDVATIPDLIVADGSITLAKMSNVGTGTLFYRKSAGSGVPEVQSLATLKSDLGLTGVNSGDQDLSGLASKLVEINGYPILGDVTLDATDVGAPTGSGTSTGINTGDETEARILTALGLSSISGINTGDETYGRILTLFSLTGEGYTLISETELGRIETIGGVQTITLPSDTTVAGRIFGAVEGIDYPTGWVLTTGDSEYDLLITHTVSRNIANVSVFSVDGTGKERMLVPFNNAYTGILTIDVDSFQVEALTDVQLEIKIYIQFV